MDDQANNPAPDAGADVAAVPDDGTTTVTLTKSIPVFADRVTVLKLRKPTAADIISIGNPVEFDPISEPPKITHNMARMAAMISRLANIPTSSVGFMEPQDLVSAAWALSPHFMPRPGTI